MKCMRFIYYRFIWHLILLFHGRHQFSQQDLNSKMIVQRFLAKKSRDLLPQWNHQGPHSCYGTMIFQRACPVLQIVRCMNMGELVSMSSWWKSWRHPKICKQKLIVDARRERNLSFDPQRGANEIIEPISLSVYNVLWCFAVCLIMFYCDLCIIFVASLRRHVALLRCGSYVLKTAWTTRGQVEALTNPSFVKVAAFLVLKQILKRHIGAKNLWCEDALFFCVTQLVCKGSGS